MDSKSYGPYHMQFKSFDVCKGPKQTEDGIFEIRDSKNMSHVVLYLELPKEAHPTAGKIIVNSITNNVTKKLYTHPVNKPCEHFVLGPVLYDLLNMTKSCKVKKGSYMLHLDFQARAKVFLSKKFFYGTYFFKTMAYSKQKREICKVNLVGNGARWHLSQWRPLANFQKHNINYRLKTMTTTLNSRARRRRARTPKL
ncbi:unnamed protein product [Chrysodeixis includens]|uniref:Uncharacterized protein n=1 Tax=Chrysodeixis includens TaxID=689277 RepID=A0A9N8KSJ8_CHRIL|nr:unnamed protein product [Chrysodeixis includens]